VSFCTHNNVSDLEVEHDVVVEHAVCSHPAMRSVQGYSCKIVPLGQLCDRNFIVSCCFFPSETPVLPVFSKLDPVERAQDRRLPEFE
jgi:hypothetical protein